MCTSEIEENDKFLESAQEKYSTCTKAFHLSKAKLLDLQKKKTIVGPPENICMTNTPDHDNRYASTKFPPCDTEIFQGGYEEWSSFWDMFTAV